MARQQGVIRGLRPLVWMVVALGVGCAGVPTPPVDPEVALVAQMADIGRRVSRDASDKYLYGELSAGALQDFQRHASNFAAAHKAFVQAAPHDTRTRAIFLDEMRRTTHEMAADGKLYGFQARPGGLGWGGGSDLTVDVFVW